jgi:hypothetical protein
MDNKEEISTTIYQGYSIADFNKKNMDDVADNIADNVSDNVADNVIDNMGDDNTSTIHTEETTLSHSIQKVDQENIIQKLNNINDPFWFQDYKILFYKERLTNFFPTMSMTFIEKLNAIFRLSIYLSIALYLVTSNYLYLYILFIVGGFTVFLYNNQKENVEMYFNSDPNSNQNIIQKDIIDKQNNIKPTVENPFMNINLITDDKTKDAPPPSWNNEEIQKEIEDKFGYNLYRDVGDLYGKNNSQREFYTVPSAKIPNDQTSFAKWCYGTTKTCKESSIYCAPEMDQVPYVDTTNPYTLTNVKY